MSKRKIYFRADAGVDIGYGHFIRTLALADMLRGDFDCTFFTCHPTPYQVSEMEKVCPFVALQEERHYNEFLSYLQGDEILVLDNYFFDTGYQRAIKQRGCLLICIDDMHNKHYVADILINHALADPSLFNVEPYAKLCLGFDWALLRKPFLEAAKKKHLFSGRIEKVAICFGGCDIYDITGYFVNQVFQLHTVSSITAIVGDAYNPRNPLKEDNRLVYRSRLTARGIADLFCDSDLVICSASSICIEALSCGAKVAVGWYVDNQADFYNLLTSNDWAIGLGYVAQPFVNLCDVDLLQSTNIHMDDSIQERYISLFRELERGYYLREARSTDVDILYRWVNDPMVRQNAFNTDEINYENHCNWFRECLQSEDVKIYIFVIGGEIVGQVRLNIDENGEALIDYSIAPAYRGKGFGNKIIEMIGKDVKNMKNVTSLVAYVKLENVPSQRVFLKNDFLKCQDEQNVIKFTKFIKANK